MCVRFLGMRLGPLCKTTASVEFVLGAHLSKLALCVHEARSAVNARSVQATRTIYLGCSEFNLCQQ